MKDVCKSLHLHPPYNQPPACSTCYIVPLLFRCAPASGAEVFSAQSASAHNLHKLVKGRSSSKCRVVPRAQRRQARPAPPLQI